MIVSGLWLIVSNELTRRLLNRPPVSSNSSLQKHPETVIRQEQRTQESHEQTLSQPLQQRSGNNNQRAFISSDSVKINPSISSPNKIASTPSFDVESSNEEDHWATAMSELESGQRRPGLWAKAYAESEGDETKAKVAYLKARVQQLTDAANAAQAQKDALRQAESETVRTEALARKRTIEDAISMFSENKEVPDEKLRLILQNAENHLLISLRNSVTGDTLLHVCAKRNMVQEVNTLLMAGADPQLSNNKGVRPEFVTNNAFVRALIREGALPPEKVQRAQELGIEFDGEVFTYANFQCDRIDDAIAHVEKTQQLSALEVTAQESIAQQTSTSHAIESFVELIDNQAPIENVIAALTKLEADGYDTESLELIVNDRLGIEGSRTLTEALDLRSKEKSST